MTNFDLRKFLTENRLTKNSRALSETSIVNKYGQFKENDVVQIEKDYVGGSMIGQDKAETGIYHGGWVPADQLGKFAGKIGRIIKILPKYEVAYVNFPGDKNLYSFPFHVLIPSSVKLPPYWNAPMEGIEEEFSGPSDIVYAEDHSRPGFRNMINLVFDLRSVEYDQARQALDPGNPQIRQALDSMGGENIPYINLQKLQAILDPDTDPEFIDYVFASLTTIADSLYTQSTPKWKVDRGDPRPRITSSPVRTEPGSIEVVVNFNPPLQYN